MNKNKVLNIFIVFALLLTFSVSVQADPVTDLQGQQNEQELLINGYNNSLSQAIDHVQEIERAIEALDVKIETIMPEINKNLIAISRSEAKITQAQQVVEKAEQDIYVQESLLGMRMRAMYKNGTQGYISLLVEATDFINLVTRIEIVSKMIEFDKNVQNDLIKQKKNYESMKLSLEEDNKKLVSLKNENEEKLASIEGAKAIQLELIKEAKIQEELYSSKISEANASIAAAEKRIRALSTTADTRSIPSRGTSIYSTDEVVVFAANYIGLPYRYGGTSPTTGFDCSGFVQFVYKNFGMYLGRTTYDQIKEGVGVARNDLGVGDLVFFGSWSNPTHVGIYVGDNCYIHSPRTGDSIKVSSMDRSGFITGRRLR